jgi:hypothetical protein
LTLVIAETFMLLAYGPRLGDSTLLREKLREIAVVAGCKDPVVAMTQNHDTQESVFTVECEIPEPSTENGP